MDDEHYFESLEEPQPTDDEEWELHRDEISKSKQEQAQWDEFVRRDRLAELAEQALPILKDLADPNPCEHDPHGNCQSHSWPIDNPGSQPCPQARLKKLLTTHTVPENSR